MLKKMVFSATIVLLMFSMTACSQSSSATMARRQEQQLRQSVSKVGVPYLPNARELQLAHDIYQLRDRAIPTFVYVFSPMKGCFVYLGASIGYPLPYSAQMTAPHVPGAANTSPTLYHGDDQAEPNGLFMPDSAEGTWIMVPINNGQNTEARYFEERINVTQTRMDHGECSQ